MSLQVVGFVTLYHPAKKVVEYLMRYSSFLDKVFMFDNTEDAEHSAWFSKYPWIEYFSDGINEGIAKRLNQAGMLAIQQGYEWLLAMDQDSYFEREVLHWYFQCIERYPNRNDVAVFGTAWGRELLTSSTHCIAEPSTSIIISGSVVNLNIWTKVGGFDENLFIDFVDHEYAKRTELAGFSSIQFNNIYLRHELGQIVNRSSIKTLYLLKKEKIIHQPVRCYYMYRNMLYLQKKFGMADPAFVKKIRNITRSEINKALLYGSRPFEVLKYVRLAKKDFQDKRMGQLRPPEQ